MSIERENELEQYFFVIPITQDERKGKFTGIAEDKIIIDSEEWTCTGTKVQMVEGKPMLISENPCISDMPATDGSSRTYTQHRGPFILVNERKILF